MDCLFCKIVAGEIPSKKLFEDEQVLAFHDIAPQAPHHFLVIPKQHITTLNDINADNTQLLGHMNLVGAQLAEELGVAEAGYRFVMNCNRHGGQTVFHIHLHVLAGRHMNWPPG